MPSEILVTGGLGYIGSHTIVELMHRGHRIAVLDNLSNSNEHVIKGIQRITGKNLKFYQGDIRDSEIFQMMFKKHDFENIMHLYALKAVGQWSHLGFRSFPDIGLLRLVSLSTFMMLFGSLIFLFSLVVGFLSLPTRRNRS